MEQPAHPGACLNCAAPLHDHYCARCGQPASTHRFSTAHLLHELPHTIWHIDKGVLYTLREMLRRPGAAIRGYLAGQRRAHFAPLSYLLLLTGTAAFLMAALHIVPFDLHDASVLARARQLQLHVFGSIVKYKGWLDVLLLPLTAALTRLLLRRGGFNYAECIVANAFVIGTTVVITLLLLPLLYYWSGLPPVAVVTKASVVVLLLFQARMYGQLLDHTSLSAFSRYGRGLLVSIGNYLLTILLIIAVVTATNWSTIKQLPPGSAHAGTSASGRSQP